MPSGLPFGWARTLLGDIVDSAAPGFACGEGVSQGLLQLRMNNVTVDGTLDWSDRRRVPADAGDLDRYGLEPGDIMFNCTNSSDLVGKTALFSGFGEPVAYSNHFLRVRLNRTRAEPGYVSWWLFRQWRRREFERLAICWVNQATVRKGDLLEMQIELPDLPVQRRIAGILGQADRLRRMRRYALELSDQFLPALFLRMFGDPAANPNGWPTRQIEDALASATYGTSEKSNADGRGYHIIGMACLGDSGELNLSKMAYVNLAPEEFDDLQLRPGDVIFNRTNSEELVGKTAVWRSGQPAVLASYLVRLRLKPACDSEFFAALLNTGHYKRLFRLRCRKAVNQANVSPTLLAEFPMYDPPEPLQREYGRIVREQLLERAIHREALRQAEHLFQSLLNQYFGGEY